MFMPKRLDSSKASTTAEEVNALPASRMEVRAVAITLTTKPPISLQAKSRPRSDLANRR